MKMGVRFAHLADCHLGGWRQEELQKLNFESFQQVVSKCISEKVDFILIAGDLFDSAYPPIEILKETFAEFKKIHDACIPVYLIAGSHDFSASGKTFLDVLEKAGFCKNIENYEIIEPEKEEKEQKIKLKPVIVNNEIAVFGYAGRKSGMEVSEIKRIVFDSVYPFTIFMVHTTIEDVAGNLPIEYITKKELPLANYHAFGHIHKRFFLEEKNTIYTYPGPVFPNNFQELIDLQQGSFNLVEVNNGKVKVESILIPTKEVVFVEISLENAFTATQDIILELDKKNLKDKIVLLKLKGVLKQGKSGDINFDEIHGFVRKKGAYVFLRNISSLVLPEFEMQIETKEDENVEEKVLKEYSDKNPNEFNKFLPRLMNAFSIEKKEDEKIAIFENRLLDELKEILNLKEVVK